MHVEIITPEKRIVNEESRLTVLPTAEGEVGVEEGHAFMMATLTPGEMRIYVDEEQLLFAVSGGVADVRPDCAIILADAVERAEEIDVERAKRAEERARKRLKEAAGDTEMDIGRAEIALARAINRIKVGGK